MFHLYSFDFQFTTVLYRDLCYLNDNGQSSSNNYLMTEKREGPEGKKRVSRADNNMYFLETGYCEAHTFLDNSGRCFIAYTKNIRLKKERECVVSACFMTVID